MEKGVRGNSGEDTAKNAAINGIVASNAVGTVIVWMLLAFTVGQTSGGEIYLLSVFTLVPMLMGFILESFREDSGATRKHKLYTSALNYVVALVICLVVLHEGAICIIIAAPLVMLFHVFGVALYTAVSNFRKGRLRSSVVPLLLVFCVVDIYVPHQFETSESDMLTIKAPPTAVWQYLASYPRNDSPCDYWLWSVGLPMPIRSVAVSAQVGAERKCEFTGGVSAAEIITVSEPGKRLAFSVTRQPDHPEAVGHFKLERGEFLLQDNGNGTTTLTGTSWYSLRVYPAVYYNLWVNDIVKRVHLRVMNHVKRLAEADVIAGQKTRL